VNQADGPDGRAGYTTCMGTRKVLRVAVLQPALHWLRPIPNMHALRQEAERLARPGAIDLIVLPETFNAQPCDFDEGESGRQARQFLATLARACGAAVVGGSIDYAHEDGSRRNTCFVVAADGREIGRYDKRVLFGRELDGRQAGNAPGIFELAGLRVGVLICADLWDPMLARELVGRVDVLCVPCKTTVLSERYTRYARALWWNLALTRAMENGVVVAVSDWAEGRHEATRLVAGSTLRETHFTSGAASLCDPSHRPDLDRIQRTLKGPAAGAIVADVDLDALERYRAYRRSVGLLPAEPAESFG